MTYITSINKDWVYEIYNSAKWRTEQRIILAKIFLPNGILFADIAEKEDTSIIEGYNAIKLAISNCNGIQTLRIKYIRTHEQYEIVHKVYTITGNFAVVTAMPIEMEDCNKKEEKNK